MIGIKGALTGLAKYLGAGAASSSIGAIGSRAITGAALGAMGTAMYNESTGNDMSLGKGAMMGALALGGFKAGRMALKSNSVLKSNRFFKQGLFGAEKLADSTASKFSTLVQGIADNPERGSIGKFLNKNAAYIPAAREIVGGMAPGAIIGAGVGAGYGMFSDRESMLSGAFKGALLGAVAGGAKRGITGQFSKYGKPAVNITSTNKAINPIQSTVKDIRGLKSPSSSKSYSSIRDIKNKVTRQPQINKMKSYLKNKNQITPRYSRITNLALGV